MNLFTFTLGWLLMAAYYPAMNSAFVTIQPSSSMPSSISASSLREQTSVPHSHRHYCNHHHPSLLCASSKDDNAITDFHLAPHYTSQPVLTWLQQMAISYKLERREDLVDVILREESSNNVGHYANDDTATIIGSSNANNNNNDDDDPKTIHLLQLAAACAQTNIPIASHDFLRDPSGDAIYNYGNIAFLDGFGYEWEEFVRLPSSKCVEEVEVEERQRLLDAVKTNVIKSNDAAGGDDDGMDGDDELASKDDNLIRVRKDGRKILLKGVNLWNVYDVSLKDMEHPDSLRARMEQGKIKAIGQAVWIRHVEYLD